ncbi:hypothetical protein BDA99DRAFT_511317 [Phascolomyces articulosus]|uniref:Uncharacterized protein n=1 Tax=Phascolomyces articulosus TaxID=60185 RepID=A0AAD5JZ38_9FUNG|nr:hypothetical protein BDA99DRAFT_511317 [Phascolomyces articulosus]
MPIKPPAFSTRQLLGLPPDAKAIRDYLNSICDPLPEPVVKKFPDSTYYSYKSLGLSFCFTPAKGGDLLLDSIDIYNGHTRDGFKPFVGKEYPYAFTPETQAHEIVSQLGEPDRKGGGGQTRVPCWIEYQFNNDDGQGEGNHDHGLMIQLHGVDWDDREMGWTSLVLF